MTDQIQSDSKTSLLEALKLNLLKSFLQQQDYPDENVSSISEAWCTVFRLGLYSVLTERGIYPIAEELNQKQTVNSTNAWCVLVRSVAGRAIFNELLERRIIPSQEALENYGTSDNVWLCLASSEDGRPIFKALLERNIIPSQEALENCGTSDNVWLCLASSEDGRAILNELLRRRIIPSQEALENCDTSDNVWLRLANAKGGCLIFMALLQRGIIPSQKALENCGTSDNTNVWLRLANARGGSAIFMKLLERGIIPTREALEKRRPSDNANVWFLLTQDGGFGFLVINKLLKQEIWPTVINVACLLKYGVFPHDSSYLDSNIISRLNRRAQLQDEFGLKETSMSILLTYPHEDRLRFFGFLYFFYFMTGGGRKKPPTYPLGVLINIGQHLLPPSMVTPLLQSHTLDIASDENRSEFIKYNAIISLKNPDLKNNDDVSSLKETIKDSGDPGKTLRDAYYKRGLFQHVLLKPVPQIGKKTDSKFKAILQDGFLLSNTWKFNPK